MKDVAPPDRPAALAGMYQIEDSGLATASSILILDDVFDTGATLMEVTKVVRKTAPNAFVAAICATYLRDPKDLS